MSLLAIAKELDSIGADVSVVGGDALGEHARNQGLATPLPLHSSGIRRALKLLSWARRQKRELIIVAFDFQDLPILVVLRLISKFGSARISVVFDLHIVFSGRRWRRLVRLLTGMIDGCVAVSRYAADQLSPLCTTEVVWRPMAAGVSPSTAFEEGVRVGVVGRIDPEKRVIDCLSIAALARNTRQVLLRGEPFMDGGDYLSECVEMGTRLLGPRFAYEGRVPRESAMDSIDVLLLANDKEPSGRVVAEAQLAGVIPVVPERGGAAEFVEHGLTGMVFNDERIASGAAALESLGDPSVRRSIAGGMREQAARQYDPRSAGAKYLKALGVS